MKETIFKNKLYVITIIIAVILLIISSLSIHDVLRLKKSDTLLIDNYASCAMVANNISSQAASYHQYLLSYLMAEGSYSKNLFYQKMREALELTQGSFDNYESLILNDDSGLFDRSKELWSNYLSSYDSITLPANEHLDEVSINLYTSDLQLLFDEFSISANKLALDNKEKMQLSSIQNNDLFNSLILYTLITTLLTLALTALLINYIIKYVKKPLISLLVATEQISQGYLNVEIDHSTDNEITELAISTKKLLHKLKYIINDTKYMLKELANSNFDINSTCPEEYVSDFNPILNSLYTLKEALEIASRTEYQALLFQVLSKNVDVVFMIYDLKERNMEYVFANSKRVLGISADALKANPLMFFYHCDESVYEKASEIFLLNKPVYRYARETEFIDPSTNEKKWFNVAITPVIMDETITKYIMTIEDLTDNHKNHLILQEALLNAQKANVAKSSFFSSVSHEIRTPLNAIIGMTAVAESYLGEKDKLEDCLKKITFSSNHLLMLINDVLDMAKIESGKLSLNNEIFNAEDCIEEISSMLSAQIQAKSLNLDISIQNMKYPILKGDSLRLKQILLNIISNAVKYTPQDGDIQISVRQYELNSDNTVETQYTITDSGYGMSTVFLEKIFEPFEQEFNASSHKNMGSGLGMTIAKNLVDIMNGSIKVKSTLGKGSCFIVTLPFEAANRENELAFPIKEHRNHPSAEDPIDLKGRRILVVEDNELNMEIAVELLKQTGADIERAYDGLQAALLFVNSPEEYFDLIIMDVQMPVKNGYESTKHIRSSPHKNAKTIPIIAMTANAYLEDIRTAMDCGMNAHIAKPIDINLLYNIIYRELKLFQK